MDIPWPDTWDHDYQFPEGDGPTMRQLCKIKKQECKDQWLTIRKWGHSILNLSEEQIIDWCGRLERSATYWQEEYDEIVQSDMEAGDRIREKWESDRRFAKEGWPEPLGAVGVQGSLPFE